MLIIALVKGVPARTTKVITVGGVLKREEMEMVMNPHDLKAIDAADFVKGRVGGKTLALSMGPDIKLVPIMKPLYQAGVFGVDEEIILSDRRMAGSDTLATSYVLSLGVKRIVERHIDAIDRLIDVLKGAGYSDVVKKKARELYHDNLLPNRIYSELPSIQDSLISRFLRGELDVAEVIRLLEEEKKSIGRFVVFSGIKSTDGETGSVGPQVSEALSEVMSVDFPYATYVEAFDIDPEKHVMGAERRIGALSQLLEIRLPALLTISSEYRSLSPDPKKMLLVRANNYKGKLLRPTKWNADDLSADLSRLGLVGSPTIVGPGVDLGKPPIQKLIGKSHVFTQKVEKFQFKDYDYGPFQKGELADALPAEVLKELRGKGFVEQFTLQMLQEELFS
jgi:electron transfer flavoprotein beta subunit